MFEQLAYDCWTFGADDDVHDDDDDFFILLAILLVVGGYSFLEHEDKSCEVGFCVIVYMVGYFW
jgi:hypothetical protein